MMRRQIFLFFLLFASPALAAPRHCETIAREVAASLRAFRPPPATEPAFAGLSIRNAIARRPAAGLDFGKPTTDHLPALPLSDQEREELANSVVSLARATGVFLVDAEAGTAHCHTPHLFTEAAGVLKAVSAPAPDDPFARCGDAATAVGATAGSSFYAETEGDGETEKLKIFALRENSVAPACALEARYRMEFAPAEAFCAKPDLCRLGQKAAIWARAWKTGGAELQDPAFAPEDAPKTLDDPVAFPTFGGASKLAPEPFSFDAEQNFFAIHGEPEADLLRIGAAREGPANMADWKSFTLVALYKASRPVASYVIVRRRAALLSIAPSRP